MDHDAQRKAQAYAKALQLLRDGLAILDENAAPGEIGAHLDLAICRLEAQLAEAELSLQVVAA